MAKMKILFNPNLLVSIKRRGDAFKWRVELNDYSEDGIVETREDAEAAIVEYLVDHLDKESVEKVGFALDLDGQAKLLRDLEPVTTLHLFAGLVPEEDKE